MSGVLRLMCKEMIDELEDCIDIIDNENYPISDEWKQKIKKMYEIMDS